MRKIKGLLIDVKNSLLQVVEIESDEEEVAKLVNCKFDKLDKDIKLIGNHNYIIYNNRGALDDRLDEIFITYVTSKFWDCLAGNLFIISNSYNSLTNDDIDNIMAHLKVIDGMPMIIR